jgi:hypothetical protein
MKTDLAPKYLSYKALLISVGGLIIVSAVHFVAMNHLIRSGNLIPFFITSIIGSAFRIPPGTIFHKCRYIIVNSSSESMFIMGNVLRNSHVETEKLAIVRKIWQHVFKVNMKEKFITFSHLTRRLKNFNMVNEH